LGKGEGSAGKDGAKNKATKGGSEPEDGARTGHTKKKKKKKKKKTTGNESGEKGKGF